MKNTTKTKDDRPTFVYNGKPVRAAGLLISVKENGKTYYLLRGERKKHHTRWSDIGGKTDPGDNDIISTIVRETTEETNNHLFNSYDSYDKAYELLDLIIRNEELQIFYSPSAKYILIKMELDQSIKKLPMKRFGLKEKTDGWTMNHYYSWVNNVQRHKLHPRLRFHKEYTKIFNDTI